MKALILAAILIPTLASALPVRSQMLKPRAYFHEAGNGLLEALDLKAKTLIFGEPEFELCGQTMVRQSSTLNFTCTISLPVTARLSKLQNINGETVRQVMFGGSRRLVKLSLSQDARTLKLSTSFDSSGIDFDLQKFNDDFFPVYAKVAQLVIAEALKESLKIEVLESVETEAVPNPAEPSVAPTVAPVVPKIEKAPGAPFQKSSNKKKISKVDFTH